MKFVAELYGFPELTLHEIRCKKAKKATNPRQLPPTENSLHQHYLRCVLQLMIWRNANIPQYDVPSPTDFGYEVDSTGNLKPVMMTQSVAAPELLNVWFATANSVIWIVYAR